MKFTALVPMKGHSERVPNKNLRPFAGEPLFCRVLDTLSKCTFVNEIIVNTDSSEIWNQVEKRFPGITLIKRPKNLVGDFVPMERIVEYDIEFAKNDQVLQTHTTNPLLSSNTLEKAVKLFLKKKETFDSVFSVNKHNKRFYFRSGKAINHNLDETLRTQDLEPIYERNANFYIFSKGSFKKTKNRIGLNPIMFEMDKYEAIDIDEKNDFLVAETIFQSINSGE